MNKQTYTFYYEVTKKGNLRGISCREYEFEGYKNGRLFKGDGKKIEYYGPGMGARTYDLRRAKPTDDEWQDDLSNWLGAVLPNASKWGIERLKAFLWGEDEVEVYIAW